MAANTSFPLVRLVRNDTAPQLRFTITDTITGDPINLTSATVTLHFRAVNTTTVLFSRPANILAPASNGVAVIAWLPGDLDHPEGEYEGEVEIVLSDGSRETIFAPLQFVLREEFA
jgi:hypothetical protein